MSVKLRLNLFLCCSTLALVAILLPYPTEQISALTWFRAFELGQRLTRPPLTFWFRVYYPFPVEVVNKKYVPVKVPKPIYIQKDSIYPPSGPDSSGEHQYSSSSLHRTYAQAPSGVYPQPPTPMPMASTQRVVYYPSAPIAKFNPATDGPNSLPDFTHQYPSIESLKGQYITVDPMGNMPNFTPQPRYYFPQTKQSANSDPKIGPTF